MVKLLDQKKVTKKLLLKKLEQKNKGPWLVFLCHFKIKPNLLKSAIHKSYFMPNSPNKILTKIKSLEVHRLQSKNSPVHYFRSYKHNIHYYSCDNNTKPSFLITSLKYTQWKVQPEFQTSDYLSFWECDFPEEIAGITLDVYALK